MRVAVDFQDDGLDFELPEDRFVASWNGPKGLDPSDEGAAIRAALENPRDFPALELMLVPGDRVVIALDPTIPRPQLVIDSIRRIFEDAAVTPENLTVLAMPGSSGIAELLPVEGSLLQVHDPDDRTQIAYLASTKEGGGSI